MPSNIAKDITPISAATIWAVRRSYLPVEWAVLLVSLVSTAAFGVAMVCTHTKTAGGGCSRIAGKPRQVSVRENKRRTKVTREEEFNADRLRETLPVARVAIQPASGSDQVFVFCSRL